LVSPAASLALSRSGLAVKHHPPSSKAATTARSTDEAGGPMDKRMSGRPNIATTARCVALSRATTDLAGVRRQPDRSKHECRPRVLDNLRGGLPMIRRRRSGRGAGHCSGEYCNGCVNQGGFPIDYCHNASPILRVGRDVVITGETTDQVCRYSVRRSRFSNHNLSWSPLSLREHACLQIRP
jgi:hypothetical protein